jgi:hypothetical protein
LLLRLILLWLCRCSCCTRTYAVYCAAFAAASSEDYWTAAATADAAFNVAFNIALDAQTERAQQRADLDRLLLEVA